MQRFLNSQLSVVVGILFLILGCNSSDKKKGKITPKEGAEGDIITIQGDYAPISTDELSIHFDTIEANMIAADSTELLVEVPKGLSEGETSITVKEKNQKIGEQRNFK